MSFASSFHQPSHGFHQSNKKYHPREIFKKHPHLRSFAKQHKPGSRRALTRVYSFFEKDDIIMARHKARQEALGEDTCPTSCGDTEWECHCLNLFDCVGNMTEYDLAVLVAGGFIDTDPDSSDFGNYTVAVDELNLYDADGSLKEKLDTIQGKAQGVVDQANCVEVLEELFTACDPDTAECSNPNTESFQLSTEKVCDAVDTPTKLLFESIGDEFDGFVDDDYNTTFTTCEPLSYDVCASFVKQFDRLYSLRDSSDYTYANPMLKTGANVVLEDQDTTDIFGYTQFPIGYWYEADSSTGIIDRTDFSTRDGVDGHFMIVNPHTGKALGLEDVDGNDPCDSSYGLGSNWGPRVLVHDYDSSDTKQHWSLTSDGKIESVACSGDYLTPQNSLKECEGGNRLAVRNDASLSSEKTQFFKIGTDGSFALDWDCAKYYEPNLVISTIEDDDVDTMKDNKAYVSFVNTASQMALSVESVCYDDSRAMWNEERETNIALNEPWDGVLTPEIRDIMIQKGLTPEMMEQVTQLHSALARAESIREELHARPTTRDSTPRTTAKATETQADPPQSSRRRLTESSSGSAATPSPVTQKPTKKPTKSPTKHPTISPTDEPSYSPSEAPTVTPRVDLRTYDESDAHEQFILIKAWDDYVLIYSPYCSETKLQPKLLMVRRDLNNELYTGLVELQDLDFTNIWDLIQTFINYEFRWKVEGDGIIEIRNLASDDEDITKVLSMPTDIDFPNAEYEDIYVVEYDEETWFSTWTLVAPNAVMMKEEEDSDDQVWDAEFVNPYINYALLPGFPGGLETIDSQDCLSSILDAELAKAAMHRCDESMSLLLGNELSLGTLKSINDDIEDNDVTRMPGRCCFDTPTNNDGYFGVDYDPTEMTCLNKGPWHLGISEEACLNAGGLWFRTPCYTLKEIIDYRTARFDLDDGDDSSKCQDTLGQLTAAYVSTDNATYVTGDEWDCVEFCRELTDYNYQIAMMTTDTTCVCYYEDGMVPSEDDLPDYATRSSPKFYVSDSTNGMTLALPSGYDCSSTEINLEVQSRTDSLRQQFQMTLDHQIISAACSEKVLTTDCTSGMLYFTDPIFPTDSSQQWDFDDGSITNVGCVTSSFDQYVTSVAVGPLSTSEDHTSVIESFFSTIVNPTTGMAVSLGSDFGEGLSVPVGAIWTNYTTSKTYADGEWFTFETEDWERQFGEFDDGDTFHVNQWINGTDGEMDLEWSGSVTVYAIYHYPPTGYCTPSNVGCIKGSPEWNGNNNKCSNEDQSVCESARCQNAQWCDTTPPPSPARGHSTTKGDTTFQEGDYLSPTANCRGTEYHPLLDMQTAVTGNPYQQWYMSDDNTTIVSLICPDLVIAVPDDDCSNSTTIRIKTTGSIGSGWHSNSDTSIESDLCSGEMFDINVADMSAYTGDSMMLSNSSTYYKWEMAHRQFNTESAPFSLMNPSSGKTIGVVDDQCTNEIALEFQDDNQSDDQHFFLGRDGLIHSQKCHGLVLATSSYGSSECSEGQAVTLQPASGDDRTRWTFNSDGSISSRMCSDLVIDVDSSNNIVLGSSASPTSSPSTDSLSLLSTEGIQTWRKVSARLLAETAGWVNTWNVEFAVDYNGTLPSYDSTANSNPVCYQQNAGFSGAFEDWAIDFVIEDASDESQCETAREALGYDKDHPFDTEVVDSFTDFMCEGVEFTGVDALSEGLAEPPVFEEVEFEAPEYPDDPELTFIELSERAARTEDPNGNGEVGSQSALQQMMIADLSLELIKDVTADYLVPLAEHLSEDCSLLGKDTWPEIPVIVVLGAGVGGSFYVPIPFIACKIGTTIGVKIVEVVKYLSDAAYKGMHFAYEYATLGPSETFDKFLYAEKTWTELINFNDWTKESLDSINNNIVTQHTEMREHLQDRHQDMVTDIVEFLEITVNTLGNQFNEQNEWLDTILCQIYLEAGAQSCEGDGESLLGMVVEWPENRVPLSDRLNQMDDALGQIQKTLMNGAAVLSTERLLGAETESNHVEWQVEDTTRKLEGKMKVMEGKLAGKLAAVDSKINSKMDAMEGKMDAMEGKMDAMEGKMDAMESKLNDIIQLLSVLKEE